ncbi:metal-dependent phosphoesterase, php family protein [Halogeometricum pallidum JCM 14848]|uniref:Metal-dependent phosphoesterase, php family protein n=1 Tax=Halogeometricum pallidum JCM 14848 TaxID=1227487 RepID=M0D883_HALPD|nr:PHP domain-containing protein [Halogeometricum pallidum]ELZ30902.1 metal-dependent phosphoesterase, php family protein [Halogeometricum pallidum JCM 14848]
MIRERNGDGGDEAPAADLHLHTTASDGVLTVPEVPAAATAGGVDVVAVTDHDRIHPDLDAPVTERDGVTVIRGVELRVEAAEQRLDLLGYGVRDTPRVREVTERIQADRKERGREIVERVESHLGVSLDVELREGIGRPNIARAVEESDAPYDYAGAFEHLIGNDGPCYVERYVPAFEEGVEALRDACAVIGLAHPFRYPDPEAALGRAAELDAVERFYPYGGAAAERADTGLVERVAAEHDLLLTGGSDAHDRTLGVAGPPRDAFEAFAARVPSV